MTDFNNELTSFNPKMGYSLHMFIHAEGGQVFFFLLSKALGE